MLKPKTAHPPKAGTPKLVKTEPATESRTGDQYFSRAVGKALEVLEFLQAELKPLSMNEIAQRIQLSKTSAFRILRTLETLGCVVVDGRGQYMLAPGIHAVTPTQWLGKLHRVGVPYLEALSRELAETSTLAALFENRIEVIAVVESPHVIRMSNVVGHILPPNASSLGKAITAFQPQEQRERLLRSFGTYRFTKHTITDRKELSRNTRAYGCRSTPSIARSAPMMASASARLFLDRTDRFPPRSARRCPRRAFGIARMKRRLLPRYRATADQLALDLRKA